MKVLTSKEGAERRLLNHTYVLSPHLVALNKTRQGQQVCLELQCLVHKRPSVYEGHFYTEQCFSFLRVLMAPTRAP